MNILQRSSINWLETSRTRDEYKRGYSLVQYRDFHMTKTITGDLLDHIAEGHVTHATAHVFFPSFKCLCWNEHINRSKFRQ
jgi:hypothetical protein